MLDKLKQLNWSKIVSIVFFVAVLIVLLEAVLMLRSKFTNETEQPLVSLLLTGKHPHVSAVDVRDILLKQNSKLNFFTLDIEALQDDLVKLPWVYSVSIRKRWPDTIKVHIIEQTAVATWNGKGLLNRFAQVLDVSPDSFQDKLVNLYGDENNPKKTLDVYNKIHQLMKVSKFKIVMLLNNSRNATVLHLKNGLLIRLGREQKLDRIQRYLAIMPLLERKYDIKQIDYIDMRYDTGFSVGWKKVENKTVIQ